jgi:hypothetical protein
MNEDNTINDTQTPETTQSINTDVPASTNDSPIVEMPSEAQESPTNEVDTPPNKDDNGAVIEPVTQIPEPVIQPQTVETPVNQAPTNTQNQTAQMGGNEPIRTQSFIHQLLEKAKLAIQGRKRKKLDKIMTLFAKQTSITNNDVQKLLYVSDATATRYLSILETEGKIKQEGKTGKGVLYTKL